MFARKNDTTPNTVHAVRELHGEVVEEKTMEIDPYRHLLRVDGFASVSCNVGKGRQYGEEKISFMVTIRCDQDQETINEAGKLAFTKAMEFCTDACTLLGWGK